MIKWARFRPSALDITELALIRRLPSWWACGSSPPRRRRGDPAEGGEAGGGQHRARPLLQQSQGWWQFSRLGSQTSLSARFCFLGRWETELLLADRPGTIPRHSTPLQGLGWAGPAPWSQEATALWRLWSVYPEETWRKVWANSALDREAGMGRQIHPRVVWPWASRWVSISPVVK